MFDPLTQLVHLITLIFIDTFLIDLDGGLDANSQPFKSEYPLKTNADDPNTDMQLNQDQDTPSREQLLSGQKKNPDIIQPSKKTLPPKEDAKVGECFYIKGGILKQKWRPPVAPPDEVWQVVHQIVIPFSYRRNIISLPHGTLIAGYSGTNKACARIFRNFYRLKLRNDVSECCKS
jgi:hypothetical protein